MQLPRFEISSLKLTHFNLNDGKVMGVSWTKFRIVSSCSYENSTKV